MCTCIRNAFVKYALKDKGQLGDVCLGQLRYAWLSWVSLGQAGPNGGQLQSSGIKRD